MLVYKLPILGKEDWCMNNTTMFKWDVRKLQYIDYWEERTSIWSATSFIPMKLSWALIMLTMQIFTLYLENVCPLCMSWFYLQIRSTLFYSKDVFICKIFGWKNGKDAVNFPFSLLSWDRKEENVILSQFQHSLIFLFNLSTISLQKKFSIISHWHNKWKKKKDF